MNLKFLIAISSTSIFGLGLYTAFAGEVIEDKGLMVCATDKWDEKELEKGHKLADSTMRCVLIPESKRGKITEACAGKYEYKPDGSWKGTGSCTDTYPGGDKLFLTWEEGSDMKEYIYTKTGGTGSYNGASGGGTYSYESLTDSLSVGQYQGKIVLP